MQNKLTAILGGLIAGVAISIQDPLNAMISLRTGVIGSVFIVHVGGLLASALLLALFPGNIAAWRSVPWYALGAGVMGIPIVGAIVYAIPRIGIFGTITLTIVAQLITSAILDHFGWLVSVVRPMDLTRLLGMIILLIGAYLIIK
jgi:transporter family-2 protein